VSTLSIMPSHQQGCLCASDGQKLCLAHTLPLCERLFHLKFISCLQGHASNNMCNVTIFPRIARQGNDETFSTIHPSLCAARFCTLSISTSSHQHFDQAQTSCFLSNRFSNSAAMPLGWDSPLWNCPQQHLSISPLNHLVIVCPYSH
jgi:hypothetical protein